jgi:hypothetical protein
MTQTSRNYQIEITNSFAALGNLSDYEDINRALENIEDNIKISAQDSLVCTNCSSKNHGLMKNVYVFKTQEAG